MKTIVVSLMAFVMIASSVTMGAMALFTDQEVSSGNELTAGTLDLKVKGKGKEPFPFTVAAMAPGDSAAATADIKNNGNLDLRYAMTFSGDDCILEDQLHLDIMKGADTLYCGTLSSAAIGDPAQGAQAGDRTLSPAGKETLTFMVSMPLDSDNSYQGATCTHAYIFHAEQTAHNS